MAEAGRPSAQLEAGTLILSELQRPVIEQAVEAQLEIEAEPSPVGEGPLLAQEGVGEAGHQGRNGQQQLGLGDRCAQALALDAVTVLGRVAHVKSHRQAIQEHFFDRLRVGIHDRHSRHRHLEGRGVQHHPAAGAATDGEPFEKGHQVGVKARTRGKLHPQDGVPSRGGRRDSGHSLSKGAEGRLVLEQRIPAQTNLKQCSMYRVPRAATNIR